MIANSPYFVVLNLPSASLWTSWTSLSLWRCLEVSVTVISSFWEICDSFCFSSRRLSIIFIRSSLESSNNKSNKSSNVILDYFFSTSILGYPLSCTRNQYIDEWFGLFIFTEIFSLILKQGYWKPRVFWVWIKNELE